MIRNVADRAFLPAKNLFEQVGDMMILTGKTIVSAIRPPYPYGGEFMSQFLFALRLCWFPLLISHGRLRLRRPGPAGGQLPDPVRRPRPARGLLRAGLDPRVRALGGLDDRGRRGRHRGDRRPRRAQDPRGARRAAGAGRRPGQEPGRAALPGADAGHRPARRLRADLRHLRRHPGRDRLPPEPGRLLGHLLRQRLGHRPVGLGREDHDLRRDHRDRVLLQGHDRLRRCGRRR